MSNLRAFGVYDATLKAGEAAERRRAVKAHCKKEILPLPNFDTPDFFEATVTAHEIAQKGFQVVMVGDINDLHIPPPEILRYSAGSFTLYEWREAWLSYLMKRSLGWSPIVSEHAKSPEESTNRQGIIRSYQRSCVALARLLARIRSRRKVGSRSKEPGYVYGRPPYGYRVVDGHLAIDQERIELVKTAFRLLKKGVTMTATALALQDLDEGRDGVREYWDPVKIRRILKHAPLYCFGEYTSPTGETIRLPSLAILPKELSQVAEARYPSPIPKKARSGTLGLPAPTPV